MIWVKTFVFSTFNKKKIKIKKGFFKVKTIYEEIFSLQLVAADFLIPI